MSGLKKRRLDLTAKKRALLEALLREEGAETSTIARIPKRKEAGPAPLSFAQQRLWFFDQFEPGSIAYNLASSVLLAGDLNIDALERSLNEVVRRHEALRTTFGFKDGAPVQIIANTHPSVLRITDLSGAVDAERANRVKELIDEQAEQQFDLARGPLFKATLIRLMRDEHVLVLAMHHIVSDAWSIAILVREIVYFYETFCRGQLPSLPQPPIQYADFACWQREWLDGEVLDKQLSYWRNQLGGSLPVIELCTDRPRPAAQTYNGASVVFKLSRSLTASLRDISKSASATLFMVLLAAYKVLLYRYTGQADLLIGTPIANRNRAEIEDLIGFFTNTLVMRTDLSGNPGFLQLLDRVRAAALGAYAHQDLPFEYLVEQLHPDRNLSHSPLAQVVFVMMNAPSYNKELSALTIRPLQVGVKTAKFDLTLYVTDAEDVLECSFEYNTDLFNRDTISRMIGHLQTLLEGITSDPSKRISDLPLLTESERRQVLVEWADTRADYADDLCAHQLFEAQVERTPEAIALSFEGDRLSYRELNARANKASHHLKSLGAGPGELVGVFMERAVEMVVGVLAIFKSGAACLPLDPSYPSERLSFMLEDAQPVVVLIAEHLRARLPESNAQAVCLSCSSEWMAGANGDNPQTTVQPESLAYVIYTSGSTGRPKGVSMPHRALTNLTEWHRSFVLKGERTLQFASLNFDVSFQELFSTLCAGGTLILIREHSRVDIAALGRLIEENSAQRFHMPVVVLQRLAEEFCHNRQALLSLREVMVGGEQLQITDLIIKLFAGLKGCVLHNHYGPSETHVVTSYQMPGDPGTWTALPPLGRPIANCHIYLLDANLCPVPVGVPGEIYIGGACLAQGYLKGAGLTAERFIPNPFGNKPGARLYKTGDLGRYLQDGQIEFLGRNDHQVKIRGMRIELGEIEVVLRQNDDVQNAVVTVREDAPGEKQLVAYVIAGRNELTGRELREYVRGKLPDYMTPSAFVFLDALPLTPSGKLDRLALPAPVKGRSQLAASDEPRSAVERVLAEVWAEVLGVERVGVEENFFEMGGHSLMATRVVTRVREVMEVEVGVKAMFEEPTVRGLARLLMGEGKQGARVERTAQLLLKVSDLPDDDAENLPRQQEIESQSPERIPRRIEQGPAPLSFAQQRLWFLDQLDPENTLYNLGTAVRLVGEINISALERSLNEILRRHESLRTVFTMLNAEPAQIIKRPTPFALPVIDLQRLPKDERERETNRRAAEEAEIPFNLSTGPLLRAKLLRLARDEHALLLTMHHIVSDGWSMGVLVREVGALYEAYFNGKESPLGELSIQYADFALWQREWLKGDTLKAQLQYWKEQLESIPAALELPTDHPRPSVRLNRGADMNLLLPVSLSADLTKLSRREGATLFMTMLAAFDVLLYRYSGQLDLTVGTPIANRNREELEPLIGFFVNTLVMRVRLGCGDRFGDVIRRVKRAAIGAYEHQEVAFEKVVEELGPERNLSHTPLFQVMFQMQNAFVDALKLPGVTLTPVAVGNNLAKFDLSVSVTETETGIAVRFNYDTDLFDAASIERMTEHFKRLLEAVAARPDEDISRLSLITQAERDQILLEWNNKRRDYGKSRCAHDVFQQQAKLRTNRVAVTTGAESLTYGELDRRSNQLANYLRKLGVRPGVVVGICVERSPDMLVSLLGIMKAGGAYLPLDPDNPRERLALMLKDSQVGVLVTQSWLLDHFADDVAELVRLDDDRAAIEEESAEPPDSNVGPDNLAYVIYTSGSTGKPKGIMITHGNLSNYIGWASDYMFDDEAEVVPAVQTLEFDGSLKQLFAPLIRGIEVWLFPSDQTLEPAALVKALSSRKNLRFSCVPSLWRAILDSFELGQAILPAGCITSLFVGGEALSKNIVDRTFNLLPDLRLYNFYGPTETTATACSIQIMPGDKITIGRPIAGKRTYVLDPHLQPVPLGVTGELYIGGEGLAWGYLNRPDLTAESFIPDPFGGELGARVYKTRDLARYLADGRIEFLGRSDYQVKVRGFRIELGEIEAALAAHPSAQDVIVIAREDMPGDSRLVAYIANGNSQPATASELRAFLKEKLPGYMLPSAFVFLNAMPLTATGKADRNKLPAPQQARPELEQHYVPPRNALEEVIASIWSQLLSIERVGIHDNFFDLGGHSLLATQAISRVREAFQIKLPLRKLFEQPTVAGLSQIILADESQRKRIEQTSDLLVTLSQLSDEEAARLLQEQIRSDGEGDSI